MENTIALWLQVSLSICLLGVLVHIQLQQTLGVAMLFIGLSFTFVSIFGAIIWITTRKADDDTFIRQREIALYIKRFSSKI